MAVFASESAKSAAIANYEKLISQGGRGTNVPAMQKLLEQAKSQGVSSGNGGGVASSSGAPAPAPAASVAPVGGAPAAGGGMPASMSALNKVAVPGVGAPDSAATGGLGSLDGLSMGAGGGGGLVNSAPGMLRQLGQRMPPMSALVLGRKAY